MQSSCRLVVFLLGQQVHKSACDFREMAELDYPNCPLLLGNPLGLDLLLRNPHPTSRFQRNRAYVNRVGRCADASVLVHDRVHL